MAKDNVPFHSIIFPVTLRGSEYSEITKLDIASTEYLMYEGEKFSKTLGVGLFCDDVMSISKKYNLLPDYWSCRDTRFKRFRVAIFLRRYPNVPAF